MFQVFKQIQIGSGACSLLAEYPDLDSATVFANAQPNDTDVHIENNEGGSSQIVLFIPAVVAAPSP